MIKINLLPQKRPRRAGRAQPISIRGGGGGDASPKDFLIGCAALAGAAVVVFFAFDRPKRSRLREVRSSNDDLQTEIAAKNKALVGYAELKKSYDENELHAQAISKLLAAKVVPANVLQELGQILTNHQHPTMTEDMH